MRIGFWDRQGANIASRKKKMYGEKLFRRPNQRFFATVLSEMGLGNVGTWKVYY